MSGGENRVAIGIRAIWSESSSIDRVSLLAMIGHCVGQAIQNVKRSPITHMLTVITISIAVFLLGVFSLFIHNSSHAVSRESGDLMVMVFLKDDSSQNDVDGISAQLRQIAPGLRVSYTDKTQALVAFRSALGEEASIVEGLDADNPLPASVNLHLQTVESAESLASSISEKLILHPRVDSVRYSRSGALQLRKLVSVVKIVGSVGMLFLLLIAGFIIANTIKLALYNHRMEIEIMQLVGARAVSIYMPYMIEGFVQGLSGTIVGLCMSSAVFLACRNFLAKAEALQAIIPGVSYMPVWHILVILSAGALVGVSGSFLAVRRFVRES